jgi:hypothetical protein
MGCTESQAEWETPRGSRLKKLLDEEKFLLQTENGLGFTAHNVRILYLSLKAWSN